MPKPLECLKSKEPMQFLVSYYNKDKFEEPHCLWADKVELVNNHLMFRLKKELIFKVWLKKDYKDVKEALKDVGIQPYTLS